MTCEECGRLPAFMHSKTGRFLCTNCIHKDGPGQLQESDLFRQPDRPELQALEDYEFIKTDMKNTTGDTQLT